MTRFRGRGRCRPPGDVHRQAQHWTFFAGTADGTETSVNRPQISSRARAADRKTRTYVNFRPHDSAIRSTVHLGAKK